MRVRVGLLGVVLLVVLLGALPLYAQEEETQATLRFLMLIPDARVELTDFNGSVLATLDEIGTLSEPILIDPALVNGISYSVVVGSQVGFGGGFGGDNAFSAGHYYLAIVGYVDEQIALQIFDLTTQREQAARLPEVAQLHLVEWVGGVDMPLFEFSRDGLSYVTLYPEDAADTFYDTFSSVKLAIPQGLYVLSMYDAAEISTPRIEPIQVSLVGGQVTTLIVTGDAGADLEVYQVTEDGVLRFGINP